MKNILKMLLLMSILLIPLQVYGEGPKIVKAWLGVYRYNGTYYDPLGNTFEGESSYLGPDYEYVVINYQLDNGEIVRQLIKINDNVGTTNPAPTVVLYWTAPDGTKHEIFTQENGNTYNIIPLPYETEIPVGSVIKIKMNDNWDDDNYVDGDWEIKISENGISFINSRQSGSYFHNLSFVLQNLNRSLTWEVPMPYKNKDGEEKYSGIIPFNGSKAIIYDISGNTPYAGQILEFAPPEDFFLPPQNNILRIPVPVGAVIISILVMLLTVYKTEVRK